MNVFEDLLEELKEEHLLEQTVETIDAAELLLEIPFSEDGKPLKAESIKNDNSLTDEEIGEAERFLRQLEAENRNETSGENLLEIDSATQIPLDPINPPPVFDEPQNPNPKQKLTEFEFFRKRAMEEV